MPAKKPGRFREAHLYRSLGSELGSDATYDRIKVGEEKVRHTAYMRFTITRREDIPNGEGQHYVFDIKAARQRRRNYYDESGRYDALKDAPTRLIVTRDGRTGSRFRRRYLTLMQ